MRPRSSILDPLKDVLSHALPAGILFLDGRLESGDLRDGLGQPASRPLLEAWTTHGPDIAPGSDLRDWLRTHSGRERWASSTTLE